MSRKKDINSAKAIAVRYIARAPRSIREVELRLKEKGIEDDSLKETLQYLTDLGYLNDETFANQWAGSKIKSRLWGKNRIIQGLKQKGISEETIKRTIDDLAANGLDTAKLALLKWLKNSGQGSGNERHRSAFRGQEKQKQKTKAFRHLQSKGFPTSIIISVMKEHLGELEIDEGQ